jgi:SMP-30/Gluconolactonase/LRE-like region
MHRHSRVGTLLLWLATLGLGIAAAPNQAREEPSSPPPCGAYGTLEFVCGPAAAEDLVRLAGGPWIIASGLAEGDKPGRLHLIDSRSRRWEVAWPSPAARVRHDARRFAACAQPPDPARFSAHGIALRHERAGHDTLLVVNHGREAIEYFAVESGAGAPRLTWIGCVTLPPDVSLNSVAALPDGGFVTTQFYTPSKGGMGAILSGALTGGLLEWHPGQVVTPVPGTELSGANGLETSSDGRILYVAAWGGREIVRFDRRSGSLRKDAVKVDFAPDNLRWSADHRTLLVAGQKFQTGQTGALKLDGWRVMRLQPQTLAVLPLYDADDRVPLEGVSVGIEVDGHLWVGPFRGDRVGVAPLPR